MGLLWLVNTHKQQQPDSSHLLISRNVRCLFGELRLPAFSYGCSLDLFHSPAVGSSVLPSTRVFWGKEGPGNQLRALTQLCVCRCSNLGDVGLMYGQPGGGG